MTRLPVLIVGAGPVGLTAACELRRREIDCRIIDEKPEATQTSNALGVHARTLETWADMSIIDKAHELGLKLKGIQLYAEGMEPLTTVDFEKLLDSPYPYALILPQSQTEQLLTEHLASYNTTVERKTKLTDIKSHSDYVEATVTLPNGNKETIQAQWVLGCDGYHSFVRESLKIPYQGKDLEREFIMIDVPLTWKLPNDKILVFYHREGPTVTFPMKEAHRIIAEVSKDPYFEKDQPITKQTFIDTLKRRWRFGFTLGEEKWISHFFIHERLARHYRQNHLFLLGDAAHVHSPAGGQGLNTGIQDAYNLAWKLALVIKKQAGPKLLDSYEFERRPIAKMVLASSREMTKIATLHSNFAISLRDFALRFALKNKKLQYKFTKQISGLKYHYKTSNLNKDYFRSGNLEAGDRCPTIIKSTLFVLLLSEGCEEKTAIQNLIKEKYKDTIEIRLLKEKDELSKAYQLNNSYCLIRPDQYIASQGKTLEHFQTYLADSLS